MIEKIREFVSVGKDILKSKVDLPDDYSNASKIIISGMGGSGIAGDIVKDLIEDTLSKPISICRKLFLPAFADEDTLFISISYSGNTIETISALEDAIKRKCKIFGMTSGGEMENIFTKNNIPFIKLPAGYLPRVALPFMLFNLINIFKNIGWIKELSLDELGSYKDEIENSSKQIAKKLKGKLIIIYTEYPSVAHRLKSQLNENSKAVAKYDIITEMCHNEINSWKSLDKNSHIMFLRSNNEHEEVNSMVEIIKKLLEKYQYTEVFAKGNDKLTEILYLIWLGDFISYYLAIENDVDPEKIPATEFLKKELSQIKSSN